MLKNLEFKKVLNSILFIIYLVTLCIPIDPNVPRMGLEEVDTVFIGLNARFGIIAVLAIALFVISMVKKDGLFENKVMNISILTMIWLINLILTIACLKFQYTLFTPKNHSYYAMYYINIMCITALGMSKLIAMFETKTVRKGRLVS